MHFLEEISTKNHRTDAWAAGMVFGDWVNYNEFKRMRRNLIEIYAILTARQIGYSEDPTLSWGILNM